LILCIHGYMKYSKIFVIGFNKTATTTFHHLFMKVGLSSYHSTDWENKIETVQCLSDGDNHIKENHPISFKNLEKQYPKSLFILNTRELESWLLSRAKHGMWVMRKNSIFEWPPTNQEYKSWISKRIYHHNNVLNHFQDKTEKLLVVNTDCNNWIEFVANHIGFEYSKYFKTNVSSVEKNNKKLIEAKTVLDNTFKELRYTEDQRRTLNINKRLASLYKNNIEWSLYPTESGISFVLDKRKRG
jgi:hypothetical protein